MTDKTTDPKTSRHFRRGRFREQFWRARTMQARKFHFATRGWEWTRFWIMNDRGMYRGQF